MEEKDYTLMMTLNTARYILQLLDARPHSEVRQLIDDLASQVNQQAQAKQKQLDDERLAMKAKQDEISQNENVAA